MGKIIKFIDNNEEVLSNKVDQKLYLRSFKRSNIKLLPSFRFHKLKNKSQNKIYLPLTLRNTDSIFESLKLLDRTNYINLKNLKVQNHPASINSKKNVSFIKKIENYKLSFL